MMPETSEALLAQYEPREVGQIVVEPQVNEARFSPCGRFLAGAGFDSRVRVWNTSNDPPVEMQAITGHNGWVHSVVFHPQELKLYSADSWGRLMATRLVDDHWQLIWQQPQAHDGWIRQIDISSDGRLLASCAPDKRICLWSAEDGKLVAQWQGHEEDIQACRFHPDGKRLATGDAKGLVKLWEIESQKQVQTYDASPLWLLHRLQDVGGARVLRFDNSGKRLACGGVKPANGGTVQGEPTLLVFDTDSAERQATLTLGAANDCFLQDIHWTRDNIVVCATSGTPGTGKLVMQRLGDDKPFFETTKIPNCLSVSLLESAGRLAVVSTNRNSNGNGRRLNKEGEYEGNNSPIMLFELGKKS